MRRRWGEVIVTLRRRHWREVIAPLRRKHWREVIAPLRRHLCEVIAPLRRRHLCEVIAPLRRRRRHGPFPLRVINVLGFAYHLYLTWKPIFEHEGVIVNTGDFMRVRVAIHRDTLQCLYFQVP